MWVPVLETSELGRSPVRVMYWGSPVVVFRTATGRLRALLDQCAHRGVALSHGEVEGENIRCDYHHFTFDGTGACTDIPAEFAADSAFKARCTVRRYFVREAVGLIWVSVEDAPQAEFPVRAQSLPEGHVTASGRFEVYGDLRVWMDHFLDIPHCIWTHAETAYWSRRSRPAALESCAVHIDAHSGYPVRPAIDMVFRADQQAPVTYDKKMGVVATLSQARSVLRGRSLAPEPFHLKVHADLVTPLCQESRVELGRTGLRLTGWTSLNPVSDGTMHFSWGAAWVPPRRGPLRRLLTRRLIADFARQHLGVEDGRVLADAPYVEGSAFHDTALDSTVRSMRTVFARYQKEKAHLYPADSLLRRLDYGDPAWERARRAAPDGERS
jgi:nitrite reductase/ring-hydroxylating ferredoxin subunit